MKIAIDAFGGDHAPLEVLRGSREAIDEFKITMVLVGDQEIIKKCAEDNHISMEGMEIVHAPEVIDMHDDPKVVLKGKSDSSMSVAFDELKQGRVDAMVSAGSTAAIGVGATFIIKRIKGIKRVALAPVVPSFGKPFILVDAGANAEVRADMLRDFGILGSIYMEKVMGIHNPKVGLVNIGSEDTKGRPVDVEAYQLLKQAPIHFYGNIEPREVPSGECSVVVTDGFSGNIVLKLIEGMGKSFSGMLKEMLMKSAKTKVAALLLKDQLADFKKRMDYTEVGGAIFLGAKQPVIKAHGSSNAKAFKNAIRQAKAIVDGNMIGEIETTLAGLIQKEEAEND